MEGGDFVSCKSIHRQWQAPLVQPSPHISSPVYLDLKAPNVLVFHELTLTVFCVVSVEFGLYGCSHESQTLMPSPSPTCGRGFNLLITRPPANMLKLLAVLHTPACRSSPSFSELCSSSFPCSGSDAGAHPLASLALFNEQVFFQSCPGLSCGLLGELLLPWTGPPGHPLCSCPAIPDWHLFFSI